MAQVTVFGVREQLAPVRAALSAAIHASVMKALEYPPEKRFHRFIQMDREDFLFPDDRTDRYVIIEISLFEGRSVEARKRLIRELFRQIPEATGIRTDDIEVTIFETPRHNWGIRGVPGDELGLTYRVDV